MTSPRSRHYTPALVLLILGLAPVPSAGQWSGAYEQFYLPASHNWAFRQSYNEAERLFYAFDYGHSILYETLLTRPEAPVGLLEEEVYDRLTRRVLVRPPRMPLEETAIQVEYAKLVPEARIVFDWAHVLHRQTYDVWADERIPEEDKDARVAQLLAYYRSRPGVALSTEPKSMDLMDGQPYSLVFRERYPRFNGLIWSYHWLQVGLYEPLLLGRTPSERHGLVRATVARFWQMLENPPETMPYLMPMTAAIAPTFSARYPEVAIVFDNLHMLHDVISDILASPEVPRDRKRAEILRAIGLFQDDTSHVTTVEEWQSMALAMGVNNQGGPAVGFITELPTPTVPRGMSMAGMDASGADHAGHDDAPAGVAAGGEVPSHTMPGTREEMEASIELLLRLLTHPGIEAVIRGDPELRSLWNEPELQRHLERMRRIREMRPAAAPAAPAAPEPHVH